MNKFVSEPTIGHTVGFSQVFMANPGVSTYASKDDMSHYHRSTEIRTDSETQNQSSEWVVWVERCRGRQRQWRRLGRWLAELPCRLSLTCHRLTWDAIIEGKFRSPSGMCQPRCQRRLMCGLLALPKVSPALMCAQNCYAAMEIGLSFS